MRAKKWAAHEDLFKVDENAQKLDPEKRMAFHNIKAEALNMVKRARPDALVSIAFLTTRSQDPDVDDWRKLGQLIENLQATVNLPLTIRTNSSRVLNKYVDASFAVHANKRGHTSGSLTMGRGFPILCLNKQKLTNLWELMI